MRIASAQPFTALLVHSARLPVERQPWAGDTFGQHDHPADPRQQHDVAAASDRLGLPPLQDRPPVADSCLLGGVGAECPR